MKTILLLLAAIALCSCRSLDERNEECIENMPSEVRGYVREFLGEGEKRGKKLKLKNLRVVLTNSTLKTKGKESKGFYNTITHTIKLKKSQFEENPRSLIFHELGHGILKRDNCADSIKLDHVWYYIPKSIMTEERLTDQFLNYFYDYYMDELFK